MTQLMESPVHAGTNGNSDLPQRRIPVEDHSEFSNLLDAGKFAHMWRVAQMFASSDMVPDHFRRKEANCFICIQMAVRMGIDPFMAIQSTYVVHGKPGIEAKLAIALINSSGIFKDAIDYEVEGTDPRKDDYRVRAFAVRKSTNKTVHGEWIDWKVVRAEGWESKSQSKWKSIPGLMFKYRAASWFGRLHCPERLMGMSTVDELEDVGSRMVNAQVVPDPVGNAALKEKLGIAKQRPVSEGQTLVLEDGSEVHSDTGEVATTEQSIVETPEAAGESQAEEKTESPEVMTLQDKRWATLLEAAESTGIETRKLNDGIAAFVDQRTRTRKIGDLVQKDFDVLLKRVSEKTGAFA